MLLKWVVVAILFSVVYAIPQLYRSEDSLLIRSEKYAQKYGLNYRLPNNTKPLHYSLEVETNVHKGDFVFNGSVTIKVKALEATQLITLHSSQLTIYNIQLLSSNSTVITTNADYREQEDVEFLIIYLPTALAVDEIIIVHITYVGMLRDDNKGFYYSSYLNAEKKHVFLATTQFESVDARHAFPCFDEPGIRTTFDLQMKHDKSYTAISNTKSSGRTSIKNTDYVVTKFETTPLMQTYLLAFIVSDFTFIQNNDKVLRHRVFAKKQSIAAGEGDIALDFSENVLRKMEQHFGVKYSLSKMDQVAVPDFDAGAMENWGLVTYREESLLYNAKTTSHSREYIITTIAHEFAHQFFGNLVSPKWWSYLWLNEGFATLYGHYLADLVHPEERLMDTFVIDAMQSTFRVDVKEIRSMTHYVESPEEIGNLFDQIAYSKSGSVLRMLQLALSVPTFTKGLQYYLNDNAFKSVEPEDLYNALQRAVNEDMTKKSSLDIKTIMSSWELQSGFPLVKVSRDVNNVVTLKQERFLSTENNTWWIPINYVVGSNPNFTSTVPELWMKGEHQVTIKGSSALKSFTVNDWMIFNIQQTSYYRVHYDDNLWKLLVKQLNNGFQHINVINRAQLIDDSFSLAYTDYMNYLIPFGILDYLINETDYIPWASAYYHIKKINSKLIGTRIYADFQKFIQQIVTTLYNKLGVKVVANEHKFDRYARTIAIDLACQAGMTKCLTDTADELHNMIKTNTKLAPDVTTTIYCNGLRNGNDDTFMFMFSKMQHSEDEAERELLINALSCSQNSSLLIKLLHSAFEAESLYKRSEKYNIIKSVIKNGQLGLETTMDFITNNHELMNAEFLQMMDKFLEIAASCVTTEFQFEKFHKLTKLLMLKGALSQNILNYNHVHVQKNLDWISKNLNDIEEALGKQSLSSTEATTAGVEVSTMSSLVFITSLIVMFYA